ncbi:hypothetical protein LS684_17910 [Cytobacillus spongiae]|uniref:hypothetical protein n=1 Tax=Cytobacillus spongiae TaxID=2901381 RepID=UPI001F3E7607|nr:hypothetical protein [Cytobacillus spongiae]UII55486.1 hypothetical protein LS684_17910 [Cytobacillus spongiae]
MKKKLNASETNMELNQQFHEGDYDEVFKGNDSASANMKLENEFYRNHRELNSVAPAFINSPNALPEED